MITLYRYRVRWLDLSLFKMVEGTRCQDVAARLSLASGLFCLCEKKDNISCQSTAVASDLLTCKNTLWQAVLVFTVCVCVPAVCRVSSYFVTVSVWNSMLLIAVKLCCCVCGLNFNPCSTLSDQPCYNTALEHYNASINLQKAHGMSSWSVYLCFLLEFLSTFFRQY